MYLTVGEISKVLGISNEMIRFYVREGIIAPRKNEENNYWEYSSSDVLVLSDILFYRALDTVNPALLPVTIFVVIGLLSFASGSFWGLAAIAFPIVGPLAEALGVNSFLCAGAHVAASAGLPYPFSKPYLQ